MSEPRQRGLPGNLSKRAVRDFQSILRHSKKQFGLATALQTEGRLISRFQDIEHGIALGHVRRDIDESGRTLFVVEYPWVIAYDPMTRLVLRVVHGARDLPVVV